MNRTNQYDTPPGISARPHVRGTDAGERTEGTLPPVSGAPGNGFHFRIASSFGDLRVSPDGWNRLVSVSGSTIFQTHEWCSLWWEHFGGDRVLNIVEITDGTLTIGIAPFFREPGLAPGTFSLRLIGSGDSFNRSAGLFLDDGPSDYLECLFDPEHTGVATELLIAYLRGERNKLDYVEFVNLRKDGATMRTVFPRLQSAGFSTEVSRGERYSSISIALPTEGFIAERSPGVRRRTRQAYGLLGGADTKLIDHAGDPGGWRAAYSGLVDLHQRRWNAMGFPGLFFEERSTRFVRDVCEKFLERGWLWFASLQDSGGNCVASRLGFRLHDRMYDYISGFDESSPLARRRPGLALLLAMYQDGLNTGLRHLDLLRGDEKYKSELTADSDHLVNLRAGSRDNHAPLSAVVSQLRRIGHLTSFLYRREVRLLKVQRLQHGVISACRRYADFRLGRFRNKFKGTDRDHEETRQRPGK